MPTELWLLVLLLLRSTLSKAADNELEHKQKLQTQQWYNGVQLGLPYDPGLGATSDHYCDSQLVVLGVHGSRTSIVTRLITLLGSV